MKVRIGGQSWSLVIVNTHDPRLEGNLGLCDPLAQGMYIADKGSAGSQVETICHELQHAINAAYALPLLGDTVRPGTYEEDIALISGKGWADVFISNPS